MNFFLVFAVALALAMDAFAVGLSLAALHVAVLYPACIIGLVAFFMTVLGVNIGPFFIKHTFLIMQTNKLGLMNQAPTSED